MEEQVGPQRRVDDHPGPVTLRLEDEEERRDHCGEPAAPALDEVEPAPKAVAGRHREHQHAAPPRGTTAGAPFWSISILLVGFQLADLPYGLAADQERGLSISRLSLHSPWLAEQPAPCSNRKS